MTGDITKAMERKIEELRAETAKMRFLQLVQQAQYIGEVYSICYDSALVQVHDKFRSLIGGIPSQCFLIATRVFPWAEVPIDYKAEDSSLILLRVLDGARLPQDPEAERIRVETAQQVTGELNQHWDDQAAMDYQTAFLYGFSGIECRVIGTFYLDAPAGAVPDEANLDWCFGSDLSNYYPNRGLKVFKPNAEALRQIVNYQPPERRADIDNANPVRIGSVRYASTNRSFQGVANVPFCIYPADILGQKTALFGMTRVGKSNTVKIVAKAVFDLRFETQGRRIGQIIFDPNGEYANENVQDVNRKKNPAALKNVWQRTSGKKEDVVTYGIRNPSEDPDRKMMLINFYADEMLQVGKDMIDSSIDGNPNKPAQYVQNFRQVEFKKPNSADFDKDGEYRGALTRYNRRVLAYRALLKRAGFELPTTLKQPNRNDLFTANLLGDMQKYEGKSKSEQEKAGQITNAGFALASNNLSWDGLVAALEGLWYFIGTPAFDKFDNDYIKTSSSGESWADPQLRYLLEMFAHPKNMSVILGAVKNQHTNNTSEDYAESIYLDLLAGKLVIVDQSGEDVMVAQSTATRVMRRIFNGNQAVFRSGGKPSDILVYVEEAHNLLPPGTETDTSNVWVKTAKEGGKYKLGMVYATQEVSSIQSNILKNTANWLIGHLNNTDETKALMKFYDFEDFGKSIIRAQDRGFLRVKTLSNLFTVPIQVLKFELDLEE